MTSRTSRITPNPHDNRDNGALSKLSWSGDRYKEYSRDTDFKDAPPVTLDTSMSEADFSGKHLGVSGALILAAFISGKYFQDNGALAQVDLSGNNEYEFESPDFIRPIANVLKSNTSITEINLSNNNLDAEAAKILSDGIKDANGALAKFTFSGDSYDSKPVTVEVGMTEADFSGAKLGTSGAIILAAWLQHKVESHN